MMTEISLNVLDVAENSTRAGASLVRITVAADTAADRLSITIADNGCGMTPEQVAQVGAAACDVPIFRSANMSLGINVLLELVKKAASVLGDSYDIEIVERHHRRKVDAPSGTALMIADAAAQSCGHETQYVYERHSTRHPRDKKEIGISAVRGGTIVGEHEIIFAGHDEIMEIKHTALSREIFAQGAVEAAKFIAGVEKPGLYDMSYLVK